MTTTYRIGLITRNQRPYAALAARLRDAEAKRRNVEAALASVSDDRRRAQDDPSSTR